MIHGIVFAKRDAFSLVEKHTVNSNVSVILKNTYSTFHVDNCRHSIAAFDEIFRQNFQALYRLADVTVTKMT